MRWELSRSNYSPDRPDQCPEDKWQRPNRLLAGDIGKRLQSPPYKWGGNMTLADFTGGIAAGKTAGDVCACRCRREDMGQCTLDDWCIVPDTVGFDCSGFVSLVWEMPYHSTVTIPQMAEPVAWQNLQPGDVLNKPGNHVRLFVGFEESDALSFRIAESSTDCGGVCEQEMRASQLSGYIPYRYRYFAKDTV